MRKILLVILLGMCLIGIKTASSSMMILTWGSSQPSGFLIGDTWLMGNGTAPFACVSTWNCTSFAACGVNYRKVCLAVTDLTCARVFNGTISNYDAACDWCDENPTLEVCSRERDNMYILIFIPLLLGLFCLIGAATLGKEHPALKIGLFLLSFISVISATYIGSSIVGTADSGVQGALGITNNWITWVFIIVVIYFLIYLFYTIVTAIAKNKEEKLEY